MLEQCYVSDNGKTWTVFFENKDLQYLKPGEKIAEGDLYLNAKGFWQVSLVPGLTILPKEFGRYARPVSEKI